MWAEKLEEAFGRGNNEVNPISDGKAIKKNLNEATDLSKHPAETLGFGRKKG